MIYCPQMANYSLYLHIPFCRHRCSYCDFNTYAGLEDLIPDYGHALRREAILLASAAGGKLPVHTIFFGGGTPSLLPADEFDKIMLVLADSFNLLPGLEVTLEANPGTVSPDYIRELRGLGVNRVSLGMQSARPEELAILEREHDYTDVIKAVKWVRQAGIDQVNLDLIFGLPGQTLEDWKWNLDLALNLEPSHFSLYALTLEHGTPMQHWVMKGLLLEPDPDLAADMYEWSQERLGGAGYLQYEISNWARQNGHGEILACKHNLQYWRNQAYLGLGAGAHGFAGGVRTANVLAPRAYIQRCREGTEQPFPRTPATAQTIPIDRATEMAETMIMGLRLTGEGVSRTRFRQRFDRSLEEVFADQIDELVGLGLLEWEQPGGDTLRLSDRGRLLANQVFIRFI